MCSWILFWIRLHRLHADLDKDLEGKQELRLSGSHPPACSSLVCPPKQMLFYCQWQLTLLNSIDQKSFFFPQSFRKYVKGTVWEMELRDKPPSGHYDAQIKYQGGGEGRVTKSAEIYICSLEFLASVPGITEKCSSFLLCLANSYTSPIPLFTCDFHGVAFSDGLSTCLLPRISLLSTHHSCTCNCVFRDYCISFHKTLSRYRGLSCLEGSWQDQLLTDEVAQMLSPL